MKISKKQFNSLDRSIQKLKEALDGIKIDNIKPPKAVAEELAEMNEADAESKAESDAENRLDQDIAEDKVHEEEQVVSPQQEELDNSGIVPEEGNEV